MLKVIMMSFSEPLTLLLRGINMAGGCLDLMKTCLKFNFQKEYQESCSSIHSVYNMCMIGTFNLFLSFQSAMASKSGLQFVFVYGTLKRGEPNHHWLR